MALDSALGGKWVGLLKVIAPRTVRMALLFDPATASPLQFDTRPPFKPPRHPSPSR